MITSDMHTPGDIFIEDYNYPLTDAAIARYPTSSRTDSRLLIYNKGKISESSFFDLPDQLQEGTHICLNNTKVIQARLIFHKKSGAKIELFCLEPAQPKDYAHSLSSLSTVTWICMVGNLRKWKEEVLELPFEHQYLKCKLFAIKVETIDNKVLVQFSWKPDTISFAEVLDHLGEMPIPPYLERIAEESDKKNYQTVYAQHYGSVAAPTAGLHFTYSVFDALKRKEIQVSEITLHVGAGTFRPIQSERVVDHDMHNETFSLHRSVVQNLMWNDKKTISVGTTTMRCLESVYWLGVKLLEKNSDDELSIEQWEAYSLPQDIDYRIAFQAIIDYLDRTGTDVLHATTRIIIVPGYRFRFIKGLITNFHQPKSTLLLLVSAFIGEDWKKVYDYALKNRFRFLSYGDSSLLIP